MSNAQRYTPSCHYVYDGVYAAECVPNAGGEWIRVEGYEALRAALAESERERARMAAALAPFAEFARQWERRPMRQIDDEFYAIHSGTEFAASLRLTDCNRARAALGKAVERA